MLNFHVVNSVKGGCGKTTVSLYLANYLRKQDNHYPVIIDLDICGSTWYSNNESYIKKEGKVTFLNDLFYNFDRNASTNYLTKLNIKDASKDEQLKVVMVDSDRLTSMDDETLDIIENTIFQLVYQLSSPQYDADGKLEKEITDIIFDLPPGYEKHSERMVRHLLMNLRSPLYKKLDNYEIYLYMVSNLNVAAFEANLNYVYNLFENPQYSMDNSILNKQNIIFILNDISDILSNFRVGNPDGKIKELITTFEGGKKEAFSECKVGVLPHINFEYEAKRLKNIIKLEEEEDRGLKYLDFKTGDKEPFENIFKEFLGIGEKS